MRRLDDGSCTVANPYGGKNYEVSLRRDDVDGFVFWTKNARPFEGAFAEIARRGFPFVVQFTVNGYPAALERSVPPAEQSVEVLKSLADTHGTRAVVWRYDPVIVTDLTPPDWHIDNFAQISAALRGACDEVVISFAQIYRKTRRNLESAAQRHRFTWRDPEPAGKETVAKRLADIAADRGMKLTICSQPAFLVNGIEGARCIDAARLSDVAGTAIVAKAKGNREGCLCSESRDIGAYDTCPMGCVYCYAVSSRAAAQKRLSDHSEIEMKLSG